MPGPWRRRFIRDNVLRIWQAEAVEANNHAPLQVEPGIVSCQNKAMDVATGKGLLRLHEVQLPGGKRMTAQAFLNAHDVNGVKLG